MGENKSSGGVCTTLDLSYLNLTNLESAEGITPKPGSKKCKQAKTGKYICSALKLSNNDLTSSDGLFTFIVEIVDDPDKLTWLDLSCNRFVEVPSDITKFPYLKVVYLHGNHIVDLAASIRLLKGLEHLYSVTFHGNPIEQRKAYRNKILISLPKLRTLDFGNVTAADRRQLEEWTKQRNSRYTTF